MAGPLLAPAQEWIREQYTSDNGLPQNTVFSMATDPNGYAWLITEGGLVRFDGHTMQRVALPTRDGGPQRLREIVALQGGVFGIRDTHDRVYLLENGSISALGAQSVDQDPYPLCRGTCPSLAAYALITERPWRGLRRFYGMEQEVVAMTLSAHEWAVTSTAGLLHLRDTTVVGVVPRRSSQDRYFLVDGRIFALDSSNTSFAVDLKDHTLRPAVLVGVTPPAGLAPRTFFDPQWRTNDVRPCVHVDSLLYTLAAPGPGDTLQATLLPLPTLPAGTINSVLVDQTQGITLIGTNTEGLYVYRLAPMRTLRCTVTGPERSNVLYAQGVLDRERVLVMAGASSRVFSLTGCDSASMAVDTFNYQGILRDRKGRLWYGHDSLVCRYDPATGTHWSAPCGMGPLSRVLCFWDDGDSLWFGMDNGVGYVRNDQVYNTYILPTKSRSADPMCIRRGPDGRLWFSSCSGAFRLDASGRNATLVPGTAGLCVRTLQLIGKRMYLGTYGTGAWVYENDSLRRLPGDRMGYLDHVHSFMPDGLGFLWLSTNHGLFRVHQREIDAYLKGTNPLVYYAYYGKAAGIANSEFNGGCDPPYVRLANGYASFPSLDGLVWFKPELIPDPYPVAHIRIDEVLVDGASAPDTSALSLAPDRHELLVRFSLAYWGDPANAQLVYRLSGVQDEWYLLPMDQRELRFQHLPYGEGTLTIRKLGSLGHADDPGVVLHFTVRKPFYLASGFLASCAIATILLCAFIFRLYQARLRRQNLALGRMVRSRTLELQLANDRLERSIAVKERLVSIISHDIVTPLRFIARVAHRVPQTEPEKHREQLTGTLNDIALSSDKLYMNARNLLNWIKHQGGHIELRPAHVALNPLVEDAIGVVGRLASGRHMAVTNAVPLDDVLLTDRDLLGIILQNLVNNALNHSQGTQVVVNGHQGLTAYHLTVSDDGPGLPPHTVAAIQQLRTAQPGNGSAVLGLGYVIITELVRLLGGELDVEPGPGARIVLLLPPLTDATRQQA